MTREEDDVEQKSRKEERNQNKFTEVCIHDSLHRLHDHPCSGNGNDYL